MAKMHPLQDQMLTGVSSQQYFQDSTPFETYMKFNGRRQNSTFRYLTAKREREAVKRAIYFMGNKCTQMIIIEP